MPALRRGRRGDLRVIVNIVIPRRLNAEQRELLERLTTASPRRISAPRIHVRQAEAGAG